MMPLGDALLGLGAGIVVCGIIALIAIVLSKKEKEKTNQRLLQITEEQKQKLMNSPIYNAQGIPNAMIITGLLYDIQKVTSTTVHTVFLYYDNYLTSSSMQILSDYIKIPAIQFNQYQLKKGDYLSLLCQINKKTVVF